MGVAQTAIVKASLTGDTTLLTEVARVVAGQADHAGSFDRLAGIA